MATGLGGECVWILTLPTGEVRLYNSLKLAEESVPAGHARTETAPRKYRYKSGTSVYRIEIQRVRGSAGIA